MCFTCVSLDIPVITGADTKARTSPIHLGGGGGVLKPRLTRSMERGCL